MFVQSRKKDKIILNKCRNWRKYRIARNLVLPFVYLMTFIRCAVTVYPSVINYLQEDVFSLSISLNYYTLCFRVKLFPSSMIRIVLLREKPSGCLVLFFPVIINNYCHVDTFPFPFSIMCLWNTMRHDRILFVAPQQLVMRKSRQFDVIMKIWQIQNCDQTNHMLIR